LCNSKKSILIYRRHEDQTMTIDISGAIAGFRSLIPKYPEPICRPKLTKEHNESTQNHSFELLLISILCVTAYLNI
jgi:hypothetical protein